MRASWHLRVNLITVAVCSSYVTLGIVDTNRAQKLWAVYAAVTFVLALASLLMDRSYD